MTREVAILQLTRDDIDVLLESILDSSELSFTPEEFAVYEKLETALEDLETE